MDLEPFVGEIAVVAFSYAPSNWALCNGATLPVAQNGALFSLIGAAYGGNGSTTFQLPNLMARVPVGIGQGTGLSSYQLGSTVGVETVTLSGLEMPAHSHGLAAASTATSAAPADAVLAPTPTAGFRPDGGLFRFATLPDAGGSQAHPNRQPYLALHYCIALVGDYPAFG